MMLASVILLAPLLAPIGASAVTSRTGVAAALFNANTYLYRATSAGYFDAAAELNPLLHTWSLSVEEQFYFLIPGTLFLAWIAGRRWGRPLLALRLFVIGLIAASFALCMLFTLSADVGPLDGPRFAFFSPVTRSWEFAVGLALVLVPARWCLSGPRARALTVVAGLGLLAFAMVAYSDATVFPGAAALVPVLGTAAVIHAGTRPSKVEQVPNVGWHLLRPMVWLGDLSYSWYLWHWPFIVFAGAFWPSAGVLPLVVAAAVSLAPAWLSQRFLEQRLKGTPATPKRRTVVLAGWCILTPLAAAALSVPMTKVLEQQPEVVAFDDMIGEHLDVRSGCESPVPLGSRDPDVCVWGDDSVTESVVLLGDSNAGHFTSTLVGAAGDRRLQVATIASCPFSDVIAEVPALDGFSSSDCRRFVTETTGVPRSEPAGRRRPGERHRHHRRGGPDDPDRPDDRRHGTLRREGGRLRGRARAGRRAAEGGGDPGGHRQGRAEAGPRGPQELLPVDGHGRHRPMRPFVVRHGRAGEPPPGQPGRGSGRGGSGVETWDFNDVICPAGQCVGIDDGALVWRDDAHISVATAERLVPRAEELLGR